VLYYFPVVTVTLHIRRKSLYYVINLVVPCFLLSFITVCTFLLHPGSSDRLAMGAYVMYFILVIDNIHYLRFISCNYFTSVI